MAVGDYPVTSVEHLVGGELYAGHKSEYGVLEYEHEDGGGGSEGGEYDYRLFTDKNAYADDDANAVDYESHHLENTFYGVWSEVVSAMECVVEIAYEARYDDDDGPEDVEGGECLDPGDGFTVGFSEKCRQQFIDDKCGRELRYAFHETVVEHLVVPCGGAFLNQKLQQVEDEFGEIVCDYGQCSDTGHQYGCDGEMAVFSREVIEEKGFDVDSVHRRIRGGGERLSGY